MKLKKFNNFISEELLPSPVITKTKKITKTKPADKIKEGDVKDVIDRLSIIYNGLTSDEKTGVDKYFKK